MHLKDAGSFNIASLYMLPKKPSVLVDGMAYMAPKDTRPISVVNVGNRLIANVLRERLAGFASILCRKEQRGFLNNRFLIENVIDVDFESHKLYAKGD